MLVVRAGFSPNDDVWCGGEVGGGQFHSERNWRQSTWKAHRADLSLWGRLWDLSATVFLFCCSLLSVENSGGDSLGQEERAVVWAACVLSLCPRRLIG